MSRDHTPVSPRKLSQLAQQQILGPELVREVRRLVSQGFQFDLHYGGGVPVSAVTSLLLGQDVRNPAYLALGVASKRAQALEAARRDPAFLKVGPDDFHFRYFDDEPKAFVSEGQAGILQALDLALPQQGLGIRWGRDRNERENSLFDRHEQPQDRLGSAWGLIDERFAAGLGANPLSWLDLLRHPDAQVRRLATAYLADPVDPEAVTIALIDRRLNRLEDELGLRLELEHEQGLARAAQAAAAAHDQQVEDAWSGFLGDESAATPAAPAVSDLAQAPAPRHPHGAAEMLGDLER